jgi:hypothetical protein
MEEQWLVLGLCAQQPLYINRASPEKRPQEGPSKAVPSRNPIQQRREVNAIMNEPNKKSSDDSKHCSEYKRHLMFALPC